MSFNHDASSLSEALGIDMARRTWLIRVKEEIPDSVDKPSMLCEYILDSIPDVTPVEMYWIGVTGILACMKRL